MKSIDCRYSDEHDLAARYLAGKLPEAEAEVFEQHCLTCERCWEEIDVAGELRVASGLPLVEVPGRPAGTRRDYWTPLAAAAVLAMVAVGLGRLAERPEAPTDRTVLRDSGADVLDLTIRRGPDGQAILEWPPHPNAESYRIKVMRSDGLPVMRSETSDVTLTLAVDDLPPLSPGESFLVKVEALDAMGQIVASSGPAALPPR